MSLKAWRIVASFGTFVVIAARAIAVLSRDLWNIASEESGRSLSARDAAHDDRWKIAGCCSVRERSGWL